MPPNPPKLLHSATHVLTIRFSFLKKWGSSDHHLLLVFTHPHFSSHEHICVQNIRSTLLMLTYTPFGTMQTLVISLLKCPFYSLYPIHRRFLFFFACGFTWSECKCRWGKCTMYKLWTNLFNLLYAKQTFHPNSQHSLEITLQIMFHNICYVYI